MNDTAVLNKLICFITDSTLVYMKNYDEVLVISDPDMVFCGNTVMIN